MANAKMEAMLEGYQSNTSKKVKAIKISLRTGTGTKRLKYEFSKTSTIRDIKVAYQDEVNADKDITKIELYHRNKPLKDEKTFGYYKIIRSTVITMVFTTKGGAQQLNDDEKLNYPRRFGRQKKRRLDLNDPDIPIKASRKECCVYGYKERNNVAEMSCGCAISPDGMFGWIKKIYGANEKDFEINCPICRDEWDWDVCCKVADMTEEELLYYDEQYEIRSGPEEKVCPNNNCGQFCQRPDNLLMFRVNCQSCNGRDWCWNCAKPWRSSSFSICGNQGCPTAEINETLRSCAEKDLGESYGHVKVPVIRACPKCYNFIKHKKACKHMKCPDCKKEFCFSCLKSKNDEGKWPCGAYYNMCPIADRQQLR